ncbi:protein of unknown function [Chryseolinea serpens]|uniref:DUF3857 domain-containing protein n=1 Tax=Chryseolinea serpens TaxID=947013 RepID=A0A1M5R3Q8_9BACT|nr:DUF3857 domain-containing protein [Chryseolinea serpens]SHH20609.1 protein of unknown function [Chryseolinea serpens]
MKFILIPFSLLLVFPLFAQNDPTEREVTVEDLQMKTFPSDTSAVAVLLFDKGEHILLGDMSFKRHRRIKILKKEAFNSWGTVFLMEDESNIGKIQGTTYNLVNGQIVRTELEDNAIFRVPSGKRRTQIRFTFPNLHEGSIIEYSYKATEKNGWNRWIFQWDIPTLWSEYSFHASLWIKTPVLLGNIKPTVSESKHDGHYHRWVLKDVPALKDEPFMVSAQDRQASILFWPEGLTWGILHAAAQDFVGYIPQTKGAKTLREKALAITEALTDSTEKIRALSAYVKTQVKWNGICDRIPDSPLDVLKQKKGTAADINFLLGCLLEAAGFKPVAAFLSTRDHGTYIDQYPDATQFDYLIYSVRLKRKDLFLDATEPLLPYDVLPERCLNGKAFSMLYMGYRWLPLTSPAKDKTIVTAEFALTAEENLQGKLTVDRFGYDAFAARSQYQGAEKDKYFEHTLLQKSWTVAQKEALQMEDVNTAVREQYELSIPNQVIVSDNKLYINPYVALREDINPFPEAVRTYPLDFPFQKEKILLCHITIPEGYEVESLPENKNITLPNNAAKCSFNISLDGNRLSVVSNLKINETYFLPNEYVSLREFYTRIIAKQTEPIVLRKKS